MLVCVCFVRGTVLGVPSRDRSRRVPPTRSLPRRALARRAKRKSLRNERRKCKLPTEEENGVKWLSGLEKEKVGVLGAALERRATADELKGPPHEFRSNATPKADRPGRFREINNRQRDNKRRVRGARARVSASLKYILYSIFIYLYM